MRTVRRPARRRTCHPRATPAAAVRSAPPRPGRPGRTGRRTGCAAAPCRRTRRSARRSPFPPARSGRTRGVRPRARTPAAAGPPPATGRSAPGRRPIASWSPPGRTPMTPVTLTAVFTSEIMRVRSDLIVRLRKGGDSHEFGRAPLVGGGLAGPGGAGGRHRHDDPQPGAARAGHRPARLERRSCSGSSPRTRSSSRPR